ncbi:hypothetical protein BGZ58_006512 [Dissophora ornata]|nr:hypothetical protein BGZ58_006512 [Dissophora ornata]
MDKANPFNMPEIITLIGRFLPLWKYSCRLGFYHFNPKTLLRCTRVNRTWRDALAPVIWYVYNGYVMRSVPNEIITKNSHYFRVFFYDRCFSGPFQSGYLKELVISWWDGALLPLVEANASSLQSLGWKGSTSPSPMRSTTLPNLDYDLFMRMAPTLEELQLSHWTLSGRDFVGFLASCKRLNSLCLAAIEWVESSSTDPQSSPSSSLSTSLSSPQSWIDPRYHCQANQGLVDLRLDVSVSKEGAFVDLIRSCPNLENFSLYSESAEDARTLIPVLRDYCPRLTRIEYVIRFSSVLNGHDYLTDTEYSGLVLCSRRIQSLKIDIPQLGYIMTKALILQSTTLVSLNLRFLGRQDMPMHDAENICQILKHCIHLRHFSLFFSPNSLGKEETLRLFEQPWGCVELETLELTDVTMAMDHGGGDGGEGLAGSNVDHQGSTQQTYHWSLASAAPRPTPVDSSMGNENIGGVRYRSMAKQKLFEQVHKLPKLAKLSLNHVTYSVDGFSDSSS